MNKIQPSNIKWSSYQKEIFRNVATDSGHLIVEAYAGASKTTSIVESFKYIPKGKKTLVLAFNKIIQEELKARAPSYVSDIFTFHSFGLRAIKQRFGPIEIDDYKVKNLLSEQLDKKVDAELIDNLASTIAFCKYTLSDSPKQIDEIIDNYGIDLCDFDRDKFINLVIKTLGIDKKVTNKLDFNDLCWFPFVYNLPLGNYDRIYLDEKQDLNASQAFMSKKACKPTGKMVIVGDDFQALYGWRSADISLFDDIKKISTTKILTLPISYRCPKKVIELAKKWVPDINCPETAIDGEIEEISVNKLYSIAKPGCFILSRTNAPLIKICMNFIKNGVKANIKGRDVGKNLGSLIKKSKKKQIKGFLTWLEEWKNSETRKLKNKNINPENVLDRYECLISLCEESKSLDEVLEKIDHLFNDTDQNNIITLSSVHRAKGLEKDDVFILRWTFRQWLDDSLQYVEAPNEEANIAYVAATRCRKRLFIVNKNNSISKKTTDELWQLAKGLGNDSKDHYFNSKYNAQASDDYRYPDDEDPFQNFVKDVDNVNKLLKL